jgi:hypothetical protein
MDLKNLSLIIFAIVAFASIFCFIIILGGPEKSSIPTGQLSGEQKVGTSSYKIRDDGVLTCTRFFSCRGRPGIYLGYDAERDMFLCGCQVNSFTGWRSRIYIY